MNKKVLRINLIFGILAIVIALLSVNVSIVKAWFVPTNNKSSFAVGAKYSDADSTINAVNATARYTQMSFTNTKTNTSPTASNLKSQHSNGVPYLQSGIVFLNGHANSSLFEFPNNVYISKQNYHSGNFVGIGAYDNTKTALFIMAGCKTAESSSSITDYVVTQGAKSAIGWTTDLSVGSFVNWNKRFHDKIKDKTTSVRNAASSANNHIYLSGTVKNWRISGSSSYNPWYFINGTTTASKDNYLVLEENEYIIQNEISALSSKYSNETTSEIEVMNIAENYIIRKINPDFSSSDYVLEVNGNDNKYYDYILYVDGVRTNIGYTVVQEVNGVIRLFDNTNNNEIDRVKFDINSKSFKISSSIAAYARSSAIEKTLDANNNSSKTDIMMDFPYYDVEKGKLFYVTIVKSENFNGTSVMNEYLVEIN